MLLINTYRDVTDICLIIPIQKVPKYETKDITLYTKDTKAFQIQHITTALLPY